MMDGAEDVDLLHDPLLLTRPPARHVLRGKNLSFKNIVNKIVWEELKVTCLPVNNSVHGPQ